jgi:dipeptidyl-peptidase 4
MKLRHIKTVIAVLLLVPLIGGSVPPAAAQSAPAHVEHSDSENEATVNHALQFASSKLLAKVHNVALTFHWIGGGERFWYRKSLGAGRVEFMGVDASSGKQAPLFDDAAMSAALAKAGSSDSAVATIRNLDVGADGHTVVVIMRKNGAKCRWPAGGCNVDESRYSCDLPVSSCQLMPGKKEGTEILSPDGHSAAFVRDHNLWVRDAANGGAERQLTQGGVDGFAYGELLGQYSTDEIPLRRAGLPHPLEGIAWSPDGKYILALRHDLRAIPLRLAATEYLPPEGGVPIVHMIRQAITSDPTYPDATLEVVEVATGTIHKADVDPQMFVYQELAEGNVWWSNGNTKAWLVEVDRGNREERLVSIDLHDGHSKVSIVEKAPYPLKRNATSGGHGNIPNIAVLSSGREALWYSERDGWGHMYLFDTETGAVKRQITKGPWLVADLVRIDEKSRNIFFTGLAHESGRDPLYRFLYRASLNGGEPVLLTPENADHDFEGKAGARAGGSISPDGRFIVDSYSTVTQPDKTVVRAIGGKAIATVVEADISELVATGWHPAERVVVKAADGTTDLYGDLYKPSKFDPAKKYPVIEVLYPADNTKFAPTSFRDQFTGPATRDAFAFAETGAIVVSVDGRETGYRSLAFRTAFDSNYEDQRAAVDHVAAIRNLGATRPYMDMSRVGVTGHSTGGYSSLRSILLFPDFYKVAVSGEVVSDYLTISGAPAAEVRYGIPTTPEVREHYRVASNESIADHLKGKLMLIAAGADEIAHFQQSMGVFLALQRANKAYDTLVVPDSPHSGGGEPYAVFRTVKYFVENLGGPQ